MTALSDIAAESRGDPERQGAEQMTRINSTHGRHGQARDRRSWRGLLRWLRYRGQRRAPRREQAATALPWRGTGIARP